MKNPTLRERISTPEFAADVKRHAAKLDAEEQGWVVMEPKRARALLSVARAADRFLMRPTTGPKGAALARALSRLDRVSNPGKKARR